MEHVLNVSSAVRGDSQYDITRLGAGAFLYRSIKPFVRAWLMYTLAIVVSDGKY
jgi:hypothetical protein